MARKPSERRNFKEEEMDLNLTPFMNMIAILIPALLISTVFVEIAVLNVAAPAIGSAPDTPPPADDKPPLNLTVTVTDKGYTVAGSGAVLPGQEAAGAPDDKGPTIPIVQKKVKCTRYVGTWPPPRAKNRSAPKCEESAVERTYWVYDTQALTNQLVEIKDSFPEERRIIIAGEPDIEFEAITDVMDAGREVKDPGGETRVLFDEVILSPGLS